MVLILLLFIDFNQNTHSSLIKKKWLKDLANYFDT